MMVRALVYARCSTDRQDLSIAEQIKAAEVYVQGHGGVIVHPPYVDEARSGADLTRPGLEALLRDCASLNGEATHVLVWDSSRLARPKDRLDGLKIIRRIQDSGKRVVFVSTGQEADGSLASDILGVVQFEADGDYLRKISVASFRGLKERVQRGFDPGRPVPYGYDKAIISADGKTVVAIVRNLSDGRKEVRDSEGKLIKVLPPGEGYTKQESEFATLVPGAEESVAAVREMFERFAEGESAFRIRDSLNARGVPGPRGGPWSVGTILAILQNPVYIGRLVYNKRTESKHYRQTAAGPVARPKNDEGIEYRPDEDVITVEDAFPSLVDRTVFEAVQRRTSRRRAGPCRRGRASRTTYLLSGRLRCGHCGSSLFGQRVTSRRGHESSYYVCSGRHNRGPAACPRRYSVPRQWLEDVVLEALAQDYAALPKECPELEEAIERELAKVTQAGGGRKVLEGLRKRKAGLEKEVAALTAHLTRVEPATAEGLGLYAKAKELAARKADIERELAAASSSVEVPDIKALARELARNRRGFGELVKGADRQMLKETLDVYVIGGTVDANRREVALDLVPPVFSSVVAGGRFQPCQRNPGWPRPWTSSTASR